MLREYMGYFALIVAFAGLILGYFGNCTVNLFFPNYFSPGFGLCPVPKH